MVDEGDEDSVASLPATMSDIFFSLVAVVIIILLALAPVTRLPGALAAKVDLLNAPLLVDGQSTLVLVAQENGLTIRQSPQRTVRLDEIPNDRQLAQLLAATTQPVTLIITDSGQEAAFLFDSLAAQSGIASYRQIRLVDSRG